MKSPLSGEAVHPKKQGYRPSRVHTRPAFIHWAEHLPQTVFETDAEGFFTYANTHGLKTFGMSEEDLRRGIHAAEVVAEEDRERVRRNLGRVLAGKVSRGAEYLARRKDGRLFPVMVYAGPIRSGGAVMGVQGIIVDVTSRKLAEAEKLHDRNLQAMGQVAGGVAHDFNDILAGILGSLSLMRVLEDDQPGVMNLVDEIEKACDRAAGLTARLLVIRCPGRLSFKPGTYLRIRVRDDGPGIPPENLPRLFEPFFSTRGVGRGFGLSICYSVVRRHGGFIRVLSRPGRGARFDVYLPAAGRTGPETLAAPAGSAFAPVPGVC